MSVAEANKIETGAETVEATEVPPLPAAASDEKADDLKAITIVEKKIFWVLFPAPPFPSQEFAASLQIDRSACIMWYQSLESNMRSGGYSPACDDDRRCPHPRQSRAHLERSMDFPSDARRKLGFRDICGFVDERSKTHTRRLPDCRERSIDSMELGFRLDVCRRRALRDHKGDDCSSPATIPGRSIVAVTQDWRRSRQVGQPARAGSLGSNDEVHWTAFSSHTPRSANHSRTYGNSYLKNEFDSCCFDGDTQIEEYLEWEQKLEEYFEYLNIYQEERVRFAASKLVGRAKVWWKLIKKARRFDGCSEVKSWRKMKKLLRSQFLSSYYVSEIEEPIELVKKLDEEPIGVSRRRLLHGESIRCKQGDMEVFPKDQDIEETTLCVEQEHRLENDVSNVRKLEKLIRDLVIHRGSMLKECGKGINVLNVDLQSALEKMKSHENIKDMKNYITYVVRIFEANMHRDVENDRKFIHDYTIKKGFMYDEFVATFLISMGSRCHKLTATNMVFGKDSKLFKEPYNYVFLRGFAKAFQSIYVIKQLMKEFSIPFDKGKNIAIFPSSKTALIEMASGFDNFGGQAYGVQQYMKLGIYAYKVILLRLLDCPPTSLIWVSMGKLFSLIGLGNVDVSLLIRISYWIHVLILLLYIKPSGNSFIRMDVTNYQDLYSRQTTCGTLLQQLQAIWDEVGESDEERDKMLLQLEKECLDVYMRKVDHASQSRALLLNSLADSRAELSGLISDLGKKKYTSLPDQGMPFVDQNDLSLKKLDEFHVQLQDLQREKSEKLHKVLDFVSTVHDLCVVVGMDFVATITEIHPSLNKSNISAQSKSINNHTLYKLFKMVEALKEDKRVRLQKLQILAARLIDLWNLMDTSSEERNLVRHKTPNISATVDEVNIPGTLALDIIEQAEEEVEGLDQLKASRMKELTMQEQAELEDICAHAHLEVDSIAAENKIVALIESGNIGPSKLFAEIQESVGQFIKRHFGTETMVRQDKGSIIFFWSWSYWSTFALTWAVVPTIQEYEDVGDFPMKERLKTNIHVNLVFSLIVGLIGILRLLLLTIMHENWSVDFVTLAMACSNTFGLVTGAFLPGLGLSGIPKSLWRNADWSIQQKFLSHRVAKMVVKFDDAHQEFLNSIVVAQATSKQMSKRDPLRPYMNVIDNIMVQMFREDPSFKPSGG